MEETTTIAVAVPVAVGGVLVIALVYWLVVYRFGEKRRQLALNVLSQNRRKF
jgi:hypothetical protein